MSGKTMVIPASMLILFLLSPLSVRAQDVPNPVISAKRDLQYLNSDGSGPGPVLTGQNQSTVTDPPPENSSSDLKELIRAVLRDHPELILDVLKEHDMAVWALVEQGGRNAQVQAERDRRLAELANPKVPDLGSHRPIRGNPDAPITIVEYSDFECPYCGVAYPTIKRLLGRYPGTLRVFYKHNPLDFHPMADPAARYFEAIALQVRGTGTIASRGASLTSHRGLFGCGSETT